MLLVFCSILVKGDDGNGSLQQALSNNRPLVVEKMHRFQINHEIISVFFAKSTKYQLFTNFYCVLQSCAKKNPVWHMHAEACTQPT